MSEELDVVRQGIDEVDRELVTLLKRRRQLVSKVGEIKSRLGIPVYAPDRERDMLEKRRSEAEKHGISPQLIEDVLRRIMRESYCSEHDAGFKCVNPSARNIVIIGGNGQLGSIFVRMFRLSGYQVDVLSRRNWEADAQRMLANPGMVIVCVPIDVTGETIEKLGSLPEDCILTDFTSVKAVPLEKMLKIHRGPVMGLHPMFGPDIASMAKQVVVCCEGRYQDQCEWVLAQMKIWGTRIERVTADEHDRAMSFIQALRHFTTYAYGYYLQKYRVDLDRLVQLSSPIYRLELMLVGRLFAQDPSLYADIILSSERNVENIMAYRDCIDEQVKMVQSYSRESFIREFLNIRDYFGSYSQQFLKESKILLDQARDSMVHNTL